jgi:hypothetical protein
MPFKLDEDLPDMNWAEFFQSQVSPLCCQNTATICDAHVPDMDVQVEHKFEALDYNEVTKNADMMQQIKDAVRTAVYENLDKSIYKQEDIAVALSKGSLVATSTIKTPNARALLTTLGRSESSTMKTIAQDVSTEVKKVPNIASALYPGKKLDDIVAETEDPRGKDPAPLSNAPASMDAAVGLRDIASAFLILAVSFIGTPI